MRHDANKHIVVMKFGGTSLESSEALRRAAEIVSLQADVRPIVVVSAMGKTTNELLAAGRDAATGKLESAKDRTQRLHRFHLDEALNAVPDGERQTILELLEREFLAIDYVIGRVADLGELTPELTDELASFGERISSQIFPLALKQFGMSGRHADARNLIITDNRHTRATPNFSETNRRLAAMFATIDERDVPVLGGFIGATPYGVTTTLGRGGSDYSAAIVAAAIGAREIQIWTDVDGMMTCDPRIVSEPRRIDTLTFDEAAELAYFGAKVLHPATLLPAIERDIPVVVLNSRRPEGRGTRITAERVPGVGPVKCVACKKNITVIDVRSTRMLMAHGFLRRIFEVFDRHETAVDMLATSEVSVSLTIDNCEHLEEICAELRPFADVDVETDQAIVCAVGDGLRNTPGIAARVFGAIGEAVNVRMISQGASLRNLSFVVKQVDADHAARLLHDEFFGNPANRNARAAGETAVARP